MYFLKLNLKSLSYDFSSHLLAHSKNEKKSYFILPSHIQQSLSFVNSTSIYVPNLVFFVVSVTNYCHLSLLVELKLLSVFLTFMSASILCPSDKEIFKKFKSVHVTYGRDNDAHHTFDVLPTSLLELVGPHD